MADDLTWLSLKHPVKEGFLAPLLLIEHHDLFLLSRQKTLSLMTWGNHHLKQEDPWKWAHS